MDIDLSVSSLLSKGWQLTKNNFWTVIKIGFIGFLVMVVPSTLVSLIFGEEGLLVTLLNLGLMVVQVWITVNIYRVYIKLADGGEAELSMLFDWDFSKILHMLVFQFVSAILVMVGLLLFVVPGLYIAMMLSQGQYLIADKGVKFSQAMRDSGVMMKGIKLKYLGLTLVLFLVNIAGLLALGLGVIVTVMITQFVMVIVYKQLLSRLDGDSGQQVMNAEVQTEPVSG